MIISELSRGNSDRDGAENADFGDNVLHMCVKEPA